MPSIETSSYGASYPGSSHPPHYPLDAEPTPEDPMYADLFTYPEYCQAYHRIGLLLIRTRQLYQESLGEDPAESRKILELHTDFYELQFALQQYAYTELPFINGQSYYELCLEEGHYGYWRFDFENDRAGRALDPAGYRPLPGEAPQAPPYYEFEPPYDPTASTGKELEPWRPPEERG